LRWRQPHLNPAKPDVLWRSIMVKKRFDVSGKTVLVVGGRGYLGRHFCLELAKAGAFVYSADLPSGSQASKGVSFKKTHARIVQKELDVTNPSDVRDLAAGIIKQRKKIDVLVFGVSAKPDDFFYPYTECGLEGWQKVVRAELDGMFLCTQAVGRHMEKAKAGSIILMSSIYGVVGNDQRIYEGSNLVDVYVGKDKKSPKQIYSHASYAAVKGAHISMARYLAAYWGKFNIRVNCISPGGVGHPGENKTFVQKYSARVPLGRKANIEDVTGAIMYLASDTASYITGQNLIVDGGWTAW
jgi:NAD(P)-dependent dehydrogenase (short-subunit alcohol dehydrogenase family)